MISTAILTAEYAVFPIWSITGTVSPSLDVSPVALKAEPMERAMADDVAAIAFGSFRDVSFCTRFAEDLGVGGGVPPDGFNLPKWCISTMDVRFNPICNVMVTAPRVGSGLASRSLAP